ncbi:MAG TPA: cyclase family protein [Flavobacteriales bacterium]|nr:cyclase family protein [Flavobacteriales bacterium]
MKLSFIWNSLSFEADLSKPIDLSIPLRDPRKGDGASAWYVGRPKFEPVRGDGFIGSVMEGGAVNFTNVYFNPHGHGTHTECLGHITKEAESINDIDIPVLMTCLVHSITPDNVDDDQVIRLAHLPGGENTNSQLPPALIIRTLPNSTDKKSKDWANTNPPYLDPKFTQRLVDRGVEHLLLDLPSVDKEVDGGALVSHKAFFGVPTSPRRTATITEFVFVSGDVKDGLYALNLQVAPFDLDASPSRPLIFPLVEA